MEASFVSGFFEGTGPTGANGSRMFELDPLMGVKGEMVGTSGVELTAPGLTTPFTPNGLKELFTALDALESFGLASSSRIFEEVPFDFFCAF